MGIPSMNQGEDYGYYDGSRAFTWLADFFGLPIDQFNFMLSQSMAVAAAFAFRYHMHPKYVSPETRHGVALTLGLVMIVFCFGRQALHLACLSTISYAIIMTASPRISQKLVLIISMLYLSGVHIKRQIYSYGSYSLDISGPLMVLTQKVTSLAFSLHDGVVRKHEDLTADQKQQAIRKIPNPLEYYSYVFHFHALMVGPTILFADYIDFIEGKQFLKKTLETEVSTSKKEIQENVLEPSATVVVVKKLVMGLICALFFVKASPLFPITRIKDDDFVNNTTILEKMWFVILSTTIVRMKYYYAWLVADAICNASGLGFNGYFADGQTKWDLTTNVDIIGFEFALSLRDSIDQWNRFTNRWLRFVVYERTTRGRTILTYILSALWHGFYPGYYMTFMGGALCTVASRAVRRSVRPYFVGNRMTKMFYDLLTFTATRIVMGYLTFPFVLLDFVPSLRLYMHMYFWMHFAMLAAVLVLPKILPPPKTPKWTTTNPTPASLATN